MYSYIYGFFRVYIIYIHMHNIPHNLLEDIPITSASQGPPRTSPVEMIWRDGWYVCTTQLGCSNKHGV